MSSLYNYPAFVCGVSLISLLFAANILIGRAAGAEPLQLGVYVTVGCAIPALLLVAASVVGLMPLDLTLSASPRATLGYVSGAVNALALMLMFAMMVVAVSVPEAGMAGWTSRDTVAFSYIGTIILVGFGGKYFFGDTFSTQKIIGYFIMCSGIWVAR